MPGSGLGASKKTKKKCFKKPDTQPQRREEIYPCKALLPHFQC